jgi:hypothetical protein
MLELPLLMVLVGSVCFLTYEFFRMNSVYQERMHYYRFLPSLSLPEITKELDKHTTNSESKMKLNDIERKVGLIQDRIERQEAVIEKMIKGMGG